MAGEPVNLDITVSSIDNRRNSWKGTFEVDGKQCQIEIVTDRKSSKAEAIKQVTQEAEKVLKDKQPDMTIGKIKAKVINSAVGLDRVGKSVEDVFPAAKRQKELRGVEPKFVVRKGWKPTDEDKVRDPKHKYYSKAQAYMNDFMGGAKEWTALNDKQRSAIRQHIMSTESKFQKRHFIKLDYGLKRGHVVGDKDQITFWAKRKVKQKENSTKVSKFFNDKAVKALAKGFLTKQSRQTPREVNYNAVKECLAGDVYRVLGFEGAKMRIINEKHADGSTKLMIDSTEARGPNGEAVSSLADTFLKGDKKRGRFEGNKIDGLPLDTEGLGKALGVALFLEDWDKLGSDGDNLVFYKGDDGKAHLVNIDPGHALEGKKGSKGDTIHSNVTFDSKGYKNFTLLEDIPLSDKMAGIRNILDDDNWALVEKTFADYGDKFSGGDLDFQKELIELKDKITLRRQYFKEVFGDRVNLTDKQLDLLDNMEKLTSPTINSQTVKDKDGKDFELLLNHLHVAPETRKEWKFDQAQGLIYEGKDALKISQMLLDFDMPSAEITPTRIVVPVTEELYTRLTESAVAEHKKQDLYTPS